MRHIPPAVAAETGPVSRDARHPGRFYGGDGRVRPRAHWHVYL